MVRKDVLFLNEASNVAVATLWTRKEVVAERLAAAGLLGRVHAVGTLYTVHGVNYLIHTLAERPQIDTVIVFGADLSGSGEALVRLLRDKAAPPGLELMWPPEVVAEVVSGVDVVDLRREYSEGRWEALLEAVEARYRPGPPRRRRLELPLEEREVEGWPVPVSGVLISESSVFRAWVKLVHAVMSLGSVKPSEYGERQKQLLNAVVTLGFYGRPPAEPEPELLRYFPRGELERHVKMLLEPARPEGVSYTYGERLKVHPAAGDQLAALVERLRASPGTRRAVAVLWSHREDWGSEAPPCVVLIQGDATGGFYSQTAYLRSSDAFAAWPLNAHALVRLAGLVAGELGLRVGSVTMVCFSAHVYERDWGRAWALVHEHWGALEAFAPDPRGNLLISAGSALEVELRAPDGRPGARVVGGYRELRPLSLLLAPDHSFYLGWEARRALERARRGEPYNQDEEDAGEIRGCPQYGQ